MNELVEALYGDLHRIAERHLRAERSDHTLQATALLNEVYLKLSESEQRQFNDRAHFLALASRVMRQVLVDYARARIAAKRAGDKHDEFDELQVTTSRNVQPLEILELNAALDALAQEDADLARLIELRYFGGMTAEETAREVGHSVHIVRHDLRLAHAWLRRRITQKPG